jgi:acetyl esterase/lipase
MINITLVAQEIIKLPYQKDSKVVWNGPEKSYYSDIWETEVVTNVSVPTMEVFKPEKPNGTSVIIAPGGGLYVLSIKSEGTAVAKWLNEKGITAFVLKYRIVPTGEDGVKEITDEGVTNPQKIGERVTPVLPLSITDGLTAIHHVRTNASQWNIDPQKIGFMGFSAGGAVTMGVVYNYTSTNRPNFIVPVYPWTTVMPVQKTPEDAPPMLVICATDDPLGLAVGSVDLYSSWLKAGKNTALHMYSKGGHGFGMKQQNLPSDNWIERFYDWSEIEITAKEMKIKKM